MNIHVSQIYIEVNVYYPLSHHFQHLISTELSSRVATSTEFCGRYSSDYELTINMSAKAALTEPEICGPTVFRKDQDIEYTIFLPFVDLIGQPLESYRPVLSLLMESVVDVLERLELDASAVTKDAEAIVEKIIASPNMLEE